MTKSPTCSPAAETTTPLQTSGPAAPGPSPPGPKSPASPWLHNHAYRPRIAQPIAAFRQSADAKLTVPMEGLPWPDGAFDVVTGFNSFQFAGKPVVALAEVRRVLGSAGSLPVAKRPPFPTSRAAQAKQQEFHCSIASSSGEWRHQLPRIRQRFQSPNCRQ